MFAVSTRFSSVKSRVEQMKDACQYLFGNKFDKMVDVTMTVKLLWNCASSICGCYSNMIQLKPSTNTDGFRIYSVHSATEQIDNALALLWPGVNILFTVMPSLYIVLAKCNEFFIVPRLCICPILWKFIHVLNYSFEIFWQTDKVTKWQSILLSRRNECVCLKMLCFWSNKQLFFPAAMWLCT